MHADVAVRQTATTTGANADKVAERAEQEKIGRIRGVNLDADTEDAVVVVMTITILKAIADVGIETKNNEKNINLSRG